MKDLITGIMGLATLIGVFILMLAVFLAGAEFVWWVFTGDFFHLVTQQSVSTF